MKNLKGRWQEEKGIIRGEIVLFICFWLRRIQDRKGAVDSLNKKKIPGGSEKRGILRLFENLSPQKSGRGSKDRFRAERKNDSKHSMETSRSRGFIKSK